MRFFLIFLTCFLCIFYSYGQDELRDYGVFFSNAFSKGEAKKLKIKQVKVIESKRFNLRKHQIKCEQYDSLGNVLMIEDHKYFRYRDYELIRFKYDQGILMKIEWSSTFSSGVENSEEFNYEHGHIVSRISKRYYMNNNKPDTIHYVYNSIGKFDCRINSYYRDTLYYNYYKGNYYVERNRLDTLQCEKRLLLLNKDTVNDFATREITLIDSTNGFVKTIFEYRYYNKWVIDAIRYVDFETKLDFRWENYNSKKALFSKHRIINNYNHKKEIKYKIGLLDQVITYNKRGKKISTENYNYEYFNN